VTTRTDKEKVQSCEIKYGLIQDSKAWIHSIRSRLTKSTAVNSLKVQGLCFIWSESFVTSGRYSKARVGGSLSGYVSYDKQFDKKLYHIA